MKELLPSEGQRIDMRVHLWDYSSVLLKLAKKRADDFAEIFEMHDFTSCARMSRTCAAAFLKNGREYVLKKPKLYIRILPLDMIRETLMESIFPDLHPSIPDEYSTDKMLDYLTHYPEDKRVSLLVKSYERAYGKDLLKDSNLITQKLMLLLPPEERERQARIKIARLLQPQPDWDFKNIWRCYLPVREAIPEIKADIAKASDIEQRTNLLFQLIYCCKVNRDDVALLEVLRYYQNRHRNEQWQVLVRVMDTLMAEFDPKKLNSDHWEILYEILRRGYVTKTLPISGGTIADLCEGAAYFRLKNHLPMEELYDMYVEALMHRYNPQWNVLKDCPEYERTCLDGFIRTVSKKYHSDAEAWKERHLEVLRKLVCSIYDFNERNAKTKLRPMSIEDYPWLAEEARKEIAIERPHCVYDVHTILSTLAKHEMKLLERWNLSSKVSQTDEVRTGAALALLKRDHEIVLRNWKKYLTQCYENFHYRMAARFLLRTRWYKDIPIRFAEECAKQIKEKHTGVHLQILAILLHGDSFAAFVDPLVPAESQIELMDQKAQEKYSLVTYIPYAMLKANPPVPLELVGRMCHGDYWNTVLVALSNIATRTAVPKVIAFAEHLSNMRVTVRKHGIRMIYRVASIERIAEFFLSIWRTETNHSIREVLLAKVKDLFQKDPTSVTWSSFARIIESFTVDDSRALNTLMDLNTVPNRYIVDYAKLVFKTIDDLEKAGLSFAAVSTYRSIFLHRIDGDICKFLPDEFSKEILTRFLFDLDHEVSEAARSFALFSYLLSDKEKGPSRTKLLIDIFAETVASRWNVPHPKKPHFLPVNHALHRFFHSLSRSDVDSWLLDAMLKGFLDMLKPSMDASSYLSLIYAREKCLAKSPKELGIGIGRKLPELVEIFSELLLPFMGKELTDFLNCSHFDRSSVEDSVLGTMEGLLEVEDLRSAFVAVTMLQPLQSGKSIKMYDRLFEKFRRCEDANVRALFYDRVNSFSYTECKKMGDE
ncbi:hypothetical protein KM043_008896 [Ampulex compressa]|nr:hypothetical protein KM043_008896 [Ampulex compressa]